MKKIIRAQDSYATVELRDIVDTIDNYVIAYETDTNALAILIITPKMVCGFAHHADVIRTKFDKLTFTASNRHVCIVNAMDQGKTVLLFENYNEFCEYAAKLSKSEVLE